ncbi:MAG: carbohydrate ABC transporter permease [Chloroflexi bacterium]|nr:carbohydrate ABC transporter permease [Chloroflexota bacterium]
MQTTESKEKTPLQRLVFAIFGRHPRLNGMTGIGEVIRWAILLIFAVFFIMPLVFLLIGPTKPYTAWYDRSLSPLHIGSLSGYVTAWNNIAMFGEGLIGKWLVNSLWYSASSVLLSIAIAIPSGYVLATMRFRGRQVIMWLTLISMILPTSTLVLPLFLEMSAAHLVDTPWSVILPSAFYPFGVYLAYVYYSTSLPKDLLMAAKVDGCNDWQLFWYIGLPMGRVLIATLGFLTFNSAWNNYVLPFYMLNHKELYNLPLGIASLMNAQAGSPGFLRELPINEPEKALGGLIMIIPVALIFVFAQKYIVSGLAAGAVKE